MSHTTPLFLPSVAEAVALRSMFVEKHLMVTGHSVEADGLRLYTINKLPHGPRTRNGMEASNWMRVFSCNILKTCDFSKLN